MNARFELLSGRSQGRSFTVGEGVITLGRSSDCTVQMPDAQASRVHCEIIVASHGVLVNDLDSSNGTFVNGRRVDRAMLEDGDTIAVGTTTMKFSRVVPADELLREVEHGGGGGLLICDECGVLIVEGDDPADRARVVDGRTLCATCADGDQGAE